LITGVTASTTFGTAAGNINNTVNGSGLPANIPALTGVHANSNNLNAWVGDGSSGNINFNLNGLYNLDGFSFWNLNAGSTASGINGVSILTSTDGVSFAVLPGAPIQFAIGANNAPTPPVQFTFAPTQAAFVRFSVLSNYGSSVTGFAEAQFSSATIAVPFGFSPVSSLVVLGLGFSLSKLRKKPVVK
jgi:F5/8 type C domain